MINRRIAVIFSLLLITTMVINAEVFATAYEGIAERVVTYYSVTFSRTSDTSAVARVTASATTNVNEITSTITLQKYNNSTGKYVSGESSTKKISGYSITHTKSFAIASTGKYRVKVVITDGTSTQIKYKQLS